MWGDRDPEEMLDAIQQGLENLNFPGETRVLKDPKHVEHMLETMMHKLMPKSSSSSSDTSVDEGDRKAGVKTQNKKTAGRLKGVNTRAEKNMNPASRAASKIHSYRDDKPEFDSYNVFNRCPPPATSPYPIRAKKEDEIKPSCVIEEVPSVTEEKISPNGNGNQKMPSAKSKAKPNRGKGFQNEKTQSKRTKKFKRPTKTKNLKAEVRKRPISQKTVKEMESRMRKYCACPMSTKERVEALSKELTRHQEERRKTKDNEGKTKERLEKIGERKCREDDVLFSDPSEISDPLMASMEGSTPEQQLDYLRTLVEMRSRKETTGHLWDSAVIFIDQGLAYNQIAMERRVWVNRWGSVTSDVNDPATDAVLLTGLSLGGLMMPNRSDQNPFDFTNSFLDTMMEKYPVLCKSSKQHGWNALAEEGKDHPDYASALQKFAKMFPLLVTTYFVFAGSPKIKPLTMLDYGLPPIVYYQGFPSLACQHLLEKDTNIIPFLMVGLLHHLGEMFRDSNLAERLELARIVWKHLKKMIDSSSLPWVCRESFCRRHGVCKNQEYHPEYLPKRLEAIQHLATSVARSEKLYRLLVEIDEFDFRDNCPAVNSLAVSISDVHYMNVFYTVAVEELKVGYERDDGQTMEDENDSDASDSLAAVERNLRKTEEEIILEAASLKGDRKFRKGGKKQFVITLEDEID